MRRHQNLQSLYAGIKKDIDLVLVNEVYHEVKDTMIKNIHTHVYNVYNPRMYNRKKSRGGLIDKRNIVIGEKRQGQMKIVNKRRDPKTGYNVAENVEYGKNHNMYNGQTMMPRPFMENTRNELYVSQRHITAMSRGLNSRGIPTRRY